MNKGYDFRRIPIERMEKLSHIKKKEFELKVLWAGYSFFSLILMYLIFT